VKRAALALPLLALAAALAWSLRPAPPAAEPPPALTLTPSTGALLWVRPRDASPGSAERSLWVDAGGHVTREQPGLALPSDDAVLLSEALRSPASPCPRGHTPFPERTLHRTLLRSREGDRTLIPAAAPDPSLAEELHRPLAALGSLVFFRVERVQDPCAEAPRYLATPRVFLVKNFSIEEIPMSGVSALAASLEPQARSRLPRGGAPRALALLPWFSGEGWGWAGLLVAPVPWEQSQGGWGSEVAAVVLPGATPPPWPGAQGPLPEVALRHLQAHPEQELLGVLWP
jgi:hypothetical protein